MAAGLERGSTRVAGFKDPEMDHQLMRQLGAVRYGGAAVGQCLALARQIQDADAQSWARAFAATAAHQMSDADRRERKGHAVSARDQYLMACNGFRAAEYYLPVDDPLHREYGLHSRAAFLHAMRCSGLACRELWFSQEGLRLPAYHLRTPGSAGDRVLMIVSGYDGTLEESWLAYGRAAQERGYDLLLFTGPGQMDTWRFNSASHFQADYEKIAHQVLDYVLSQPGVNPQRVALMGISFGGYFAMRVAAFEPRVQALILNSPIIDLHAYMVSFIGLDPADLPAADDFGVADLSDIPDSVMNAQVRLMSHNLMLRFGRPGFAQTYQRIRDFCLTDADMARIVCPSLALVGDGEGAEPLRQWQAFQDRTGGACAAWRFTAAEGADAHCQVGNLAYSAAVSMDWLDETLAQKAVG
ncbi:alpha/beta hydrolase family protein [Castellaniella sp.]|uniref:alpha/beta hydrolase family protein n=1 Tax=Castellaniella sp. TaxID=1955812 RepID=UPI002AFECF71|nr:alpha/beta hydrolase [Castellaniella sp.]